MRLTELLEAWHTDIGDEPIYELRTRRDLLRLLKKSQYNTARAFLDFSNDTVYAWDAGTLVHPDVARTGLRGLPMQLSDNRIDIRHHGMDRPNIWAMYRDVIDAPVMKRLYGGKLPPVYADDDDEERLDNQDWADMEALNHDGEINWEDNWRAY